MKSNFWLRIGSSLLSKDLSKKYLLKEGPRNVLRISGELVHIAERVPFFKRKFKIDKGHILVSDLGPKRSKNKP